jgi:hypothetical protein
MPVLTLYVLCDGNSRKENLMKALSILVCTALGALTLATAAPAQADDVRLQSTPQLHVTVDHALIARHRALGRLGEPVSSSSFPWTKTGVGVAALGALGLIGFSVISSGRVRMRRSSRI